MSLYVPPRYAGPPVVSGYTLGEFLGRGASATVWAAVAEGSGEHVAVKVFGDELGPGEWDDLWEAAAREVELSTHLSDTQVARARERCTLDDGRVALVLDLADAGSLRDIVTIRGALPLGEVVTALTPVATALDEIAGAGVVHVDVAPGNVLFTAEGRPVLADLSSARRVGDPSPTTTGGTPGFVAPEVRRGESPTPQSDIWALGALVWYARTGGGTPPRWVGDLHWRGLADPDLTGLVDEMSAAVGPELCPVLLRMLADDPVARPTAAEAALAIYRAAAPVPMGLVGRHPDPASAVTNRLRREAAETRSRAQLKAQARADRRRARWVRRHARVKGALRPTHADGGPAWGRLMTWLLLVTTVGGALVGWMALRDSSLPVLVGRVGNAEPERVTQEGQEKGPTPTTMPEMTPGTTASRRAGTAPVTSPASAMEGLVTAGTAAPVTPSVASSSVDDPVSLLQTVVDGRARALTAADPLALALVERPGSPLAVADTVTVARLRDQRQRYRDLSFTVTAAEVASSAGGELVIRATVDRSAYAVDGEDGSTQTLSPAVGAPLRYTLVPSDGGWRLVEVGSD